VQIGFSGFTFYRMLRAQRWTEFSRYPVISGIAILAIGVTIAWWSKANISPFFPTAMIRRGEIWRLLTCIFPHGDILHLAFNVYWLWTFGGVIERAYGHFRTALLIFLLAVGSSALEFAFARGGIGLSGVGYGLFGFLWVLSRHDDRFRGAIDQQTMVLFVGWFFFCVATTVMNVMPVGNIAHAGGMLIGSLTGFSVTLSARRRLVIAMIIFVSGFSLWAATFGRPTVNVSEHGGYEEGKWGYEALVAGHDREAAKWLGDAVKYQPNVAAYWYDLGIAYQRSGNKTAAQAAYRKAYTLDPKTPEYLQAVQGIN
jgi:membrane associated rhomboid family serine protease